MEVYFEDFRKIACRDLFFEILVPLFRPKGHLNENDGAVSVARSSIWNSIGIVFLWFSLPGVISGRVFSQCAAREVLSVFLHVFFRFRVQLTCENVVKSHVGSFKNRVGENTTKRRHGISLELPMLRYGHILESFWQAILRKNMKKDVPEKHVFLEKVKMLVRGL